MLSRIIGYLYWFSTSGPISIVVGALRVPVLEIIVLSSDITRISQNWFLLPLANLVVY